jgi:hypothetical protein
MRRVCELDFHFKNFKTIKLLFLPSECDGVISLFCQIL